jgi:RND superfamily putative drug exporter
MGIKQSNTVPKWVRIVVPSIIILLWVALGSIGGPYFGKISEVASNDQATFLPKNAESTKVTKELKKFQDSSTVPAVIVFDGGNEKLSQNAVQQITKDRKSVV